MHHEKKEFCLQSSFLITDYYSAERMWFYGIFTNILRRKDIEFYIVRL